MTDTYYLYRNYGYANERLLDSGSWNHVSVLYLEELFWDSKQETDEEDALQIISFSDDGEVEIYGANRVQG